MCKAKTQKNKKLLIKSENKVYNEVNEDIDDDNCDG